MPAPARLGWVDSHKLEYSSEYANSMKSLESVYFFIHSVHSASSLKLVCSALVLLLVLRPFARQIPLGKNLSG